MKELQRRLVIRCRRQRDKVGSLEEFTNDVGFVVKTDDISHLSSNGLPQIGTKARPGMLLIGKIGQKNTNERGRMNELELLTATEDELRQYYNRWIYDGSIYAPNDCYGIVVAAFVETVDQQQHAVVEIELDHGTDN